MMQSAEQGGGVLILTRELVAAGLLGALVEGAGKQPLFVMPGESAEAALARFRPELVLLDAFHPVAQSDSFYATTDAQAVSVVVFSPTTPWDDLIALTRAHPSASIITPGSDETLADCLDQMLRR